jgi:hypothetical protein
MQYFSLAQRMMDLRYVDICFCKCNYLTCAGQTKKQKTLRNPVYRGDSRWTDQRKRRKLKSLAKEAETMPALTTYFTVCYLSEKNKQTLTRAMQRQPKRPRSLSPPPDLYQLSDSELLAEEDLDLHIDDHGDFDIDLFDYCYAEMEKEIDGQGELIGQEEADTLYGVSNANLKMTMYADVPEGIC